MAPAEPAEAGGGGGISGVKVAGGISGAMVDRVGEEWILLVHAQRLHGSGQQNVQCCFSL